MNKQRALFDLSGASLLSLLDLREESKNEIGISQSRSVCSDTCLFWSVNASFNSNGDMSLTFLLSA